MHSPIETPVGKSREPSPTLKGGRVLESEDIKGKRRAMDDPLKRQRSKLDAQKAEIFRLRSSRERYARRHRDAEEELADLEHHIQEVSRANREDLWKRDRRIKAMEDELTRTKELLAARMTELAGARSFLSTTDRRSETEVLGIVHDLNENIFQFAAKLTDEWEKLEPPPSRRPSSANKGVNALSQFYGPALVNLVLDRDPAAVIFLVQSCLCHLVSQITLSWRRDRGNRELTILGTVYKSLSTSEEQAVSARWRSLTHNHLTESSSHHGPASIARHVGNVLWITGSFASINDSLGFVKAKASNGIEIINRLALRLESMFMADITSADMYLLVEAARTPFTDTRMSKEFEFDECPTPDGRDRVAGTTGVGVAKTLCGARGEAQDMKYLLKAKVVLESDLAEMTES